MRQRILASQARVVGGVGSGTDWTVGASTFGQAFRRGRRPSPNLGMLGAGLKTPPTGATEGLQQRGEGAPSVLEQPTRLPETVGAPKAWRAGWGQDHGLAALTAGVWRLLSPVGAMGAT